MMRIKERFKVALTTVLGTWKTTLRTLRENPKILLPFLIVGLFDALILVLLYLGPRPPFSALLAPPIRSFWGERFLHYPVNLLLLPKLFNYAHMASTTVIGVLMTGLAIGMLYDAKREVKPGFLINLIRSVKRYLSLVAIWLIMFGLVTVVFKGLPFVLQLKQRTAFQIAFFVSFLISILIEVIFIYAMPAVMTEKRRTWQAIKRSITFAKSSFLPTLFLVATPMLIYIPMVILKGKLPFLMNKFFPEVVLVLLGLGIVVSVTVDCLVTCSATVLFLRQKEA